MNEIFNYSSSVTGKFFIGRKAECQALANLLASGQNTVIYDIAKSGKNSLISQTLLTMQASGVDCETRCVDMFNLRSVRGFAESLASELLTALTEDGGDYASLVEELLPGTNFHFAEENYFNGGEPVKISAEPTREDLEAVLRLPYEIARRKGRLLILLLKEFHELLSDRNPEILFRILDGILAEKMDSDEPGRAVFLFTGSMVNAMKYIFQVRKFFFRHVEIFPLAPVEEKLIAEYVVKGFLQGGKVFDRNDVVAMCRSLRHNMWYINHFCAICNGISRGYINASIMNEAMSALLSVHYPRFYGMMDNLTDFQISMVRAVCDGVTKFSTVETIERFGLNSSANVKRVREALMKKEIIDFDEDGAAFIQDPLFAYWLEHNYFRK